MQIHIGRNNQQLGTFTVPQVLSGLGSGQFLPTDIAWHEGLEDWAPLSSLEVLSASPPAPVATTQPAAAPAKPAFALPTVTKPETPPSRMKAWILRLALFVVLLLIAIPTARLIKGKTIESRSKANAVSVLAACKQYATSHDGSYPPDLATLIKEKIIADEALLHDDTQIGYEYYAAGVKQTDAPDKVIIISKAANEAGQRVVGYNDGTVKMQPLPVLPQAK